jgi:hypothetical protein
VYSLTRGSQRRFLLGQPYIGLSKKIIRALFGHAPHVLTETHSLIRFVLSKKA